MRKLPYYIAILTILCFLISACSGNPQKEQEETSPTTGQDSSNMILNNTEQTVIKEDPEITTTATEPNEISNTVETVASTTASTESPKEPEKTEEPEQTKAPEQMDAPEYPDESFLEEWLQNIPTYVPPTTVPPCEDHDYVLVDTKLNTDYQLYQNVEDYYLCSVCGDKYILVHDVAKELSASDIANAEAEIIAYVNQERTANGLPALEAMHSWDWWSDLRAEEQDERFGHIRPDGSDWGYREGGWCTLAENVAYGQPSAYDFFMAFKNSPPHYGAMMNEYAEGITVGIYINENGVPFCAMVMLSTQI